MDDLLTVTGAARELGTHEQRIRRAVDSLGVPIHRVGNGVRLIPRSLIPQLRAAIAVKRLSTRG